MTAALFPVQHLRRDYNSCRSVAAQAIPNLLAAMLAGVMLLDYLGDTSAARRAPVRSPERCSPGLLPLPGYRAGMPTATDHGVPTTGCELGRDATRRQGWFAMDA
jgi:hypothetical protein